MCGSTNTGQEEGVEESVGEPVSVSPDTPPARDVLVSPRSCEDIRTRNASLSEEFFSKKPYQEEQEIAELLQELGLEERKVAKRAFPFFPILGGLVIIAVLGIVVYYGVLDLGKPPQAGEETKQVPVVRAGQKEAESVSGDAQVSDVKTEPVSAPVLEVKPESVPASAPEVKPEPAPVPAPEPKPEPSIATASDTGSESTSPREPEAKPAPKAVEKPLSKPTPKMKPSAPVTGGVFDKLVAEGNAAIAARRFNDAIHAYKDALKLNPRAGKIHKFLGIAYASMGNAAKACEHYRRYLIMTPDAPDRAQVEQLIADCP